MPARDYKHASKGNAPGGSLLPFLAGLSLGLLVAFAVFMYGYLQPGGPQRAAPSPAVATTPPKKTPEATERAAEVPAPTFDFYKILPNREVNLSEWVEEEPARAGSPPAETAPPEQPGLYILQVGSFKTYDAADQLKAELALVGIDADIQRVVIDGQEVLHRVRIGPFRDAARIEETRRRLVAHDMDFMVLRLKEEEAGG